ncbi:MAG: hypothetical protein HW403_1404 [Dehalococcoidia bacterium]|nr:hypothetical protein [Dehalococcoidia bacterium]
MATPTAVEASAQPSGLPKPQSGSLVGLAFPTPPPIRNEMVARIESGKATVLKLDNGSVTVTVPDGAFAPGSQVALKLTPLSDVQVDAAQQSRIVATNLAFSLSAIGRDGLATIPSAAIPLEIAVRYTGSVVAGLKEDSWGLYAYKPSPPSWTHLTGCKQNESANLILCKVVVVTTYLLAGDEINTNVAGPSSVFGSSLVYLWLLAGVSVTLALGGVRG